MVELARNRILLSAIDLITHNGQIKLDDIAIYKYWGVVGKKTSRNIAFILLPEDKNISFAQQKEIIEEFNSILNDLRERYRSLFLTNFRDNNRKRISFDFIDKQSFLLFFLVRKYC